MAAASPMSTTFSRYHVSQITRGNCIHTAEPRKWAAFDIRPCPPRCAANILRQVSTVSSLLMASKPQESQVFGKHSTMKVAVSLSNW